MREICFAVTMCIVGVGGIAAGIIAIIKASDSMCEDCPNRGADIREEKQDEI